MIRVRVDDFPNTKGEPQHTLAAYQDFHRCLSEGIGGKRYLLGVIPERCRPEDLVYLRTIDVEVGMHGTDHDEARLDRNGGNQFESYLTERNIGRKLLSAADALDQAIGGSHHVDVYMPPRNVVDRRTLSVLLDCGFVAYTGGPETAQDCRSHDDLVYIHSEPPHEYGRSDEMLLCGSPRHLVEIGKERDVCLTLHWTWEVNIGLNHLRQFLAAIGPENFCDFFP